ncbi:hypothetical protein [Paenibacillus sp. FSL R5-0470]|uniref:hypothetical protein n=1 Tax=Paenibacillus sp. FSL R5-0470 TaxID=2921641 RepID=UPI0030DBFE6D
MSINKNKSTAKEVLEQNDANLGSIKITWTYKDLRIESDDNTLLCLLADPTVNAVHPATNEQDYVMFTCTVQAGVGTGHYRCISTV